MKSGTHSFLIALLAVALAAVLGLALAEQTAAPEPAGTQARQSSPTSPTSPPPPQPAGPPSQA